MMFSKLALIAALAAPFISAQDLSGLPNCALDPVGTAFGSTSCDITDIACICDDTSLESLEAALAAVCSPADTESGLQFAQSLCESAGITLGISITGATVAPATTAAVTTIAVLSAIVTTTDVSGVASTASSLVPAASTSILPTRSSTEALSTTSSTMTTMSALVSPKSQPSVSKDTLSAAAIAGICIGSIFCVLIIILIIVLCRMARSRRPQGEKNHLNGTGLRPNNTENIAGIDEGNTDYTAGIDESLPSHEANGVSSPGGP